MEFNDVQLRYESSREEIDAAIRGVLSSGRYILGPAVQRFEEQFARYCRMDDGIGVSSGTSALNIALRAIGVRAGDEVLVPAISAAATAMAVTAIGAKPIFVDVSPDDFNISPEGCFQRKTSRARAVIPVHLYGMPARLKEISKAALPIVEDAPQANVSDPAWGGCGSFGRPEQSSFIPPKTPGPNATAALSLKPNLP